MKYLGLLCLVCLCGPVSPALAERQVCGDGEVQVRTAIGEMVEIVVEGGVGDLVRSGDPSTLKVEHTSGHLFLTPLTASPAQLTIIDRQGLSHALRWVFEPPVDRRVLVRGCFSAAQDEGRSDAVMMLMRELILGRIPAGAVIRDKDEILLDKDGVKIRVLAVYELPLLAGYRLSVENLAQAPVSVPVQRMSFPRMLAVAASQDVLGPGTKAEIYMVTAR